MKNITLFLLICLPVLLFGQADKSPNLFEYVSMKAIPGQEEAFETAVKAHNAKFHADGLHKAELTYNINGPSGGAYTWIMGPTTWTAMDTRPMKGAHDEDWKKVTALTEKTGVPDYWTLDRKLSRNADVPTHNKRLIWLFNVKKGEMSRWFELVEKISEVYKEKRPSETFLVGRNSFTDTKEGYDVAVVFEFDKWSWLDRESDISKEFEEVHGDGTWHTWINAFQATVEGRLEWLREDVN